MRISVFTVSRKADHTTLISTRLSEDCTFLFFKSDWQSQKERYCPLQEPLDRLLCEILLNKRPAARIALGVNLYCLHLTLSFSVCLVPTMPPEGVTCSALTSQSVQVWWEPPPAEGRNGLVQGYKVSYQPAEDWYGKSLEFSEVKSTKTDFVQSGTASPFRDVVSLFRWFA